MNSEDSNEDVDEEYAKEFVQYLYDNNIATNGE